VSIDLYTVPGEEFALAWAVEAMVWQWVSSNTSPVLAQRAYEALIYYDYASISEGQYIPNQEQCSVAFKLEQRDRLLNNYNYCGKIHIDIEHVNRNSKYLLVLLAKLTDEFLWKNADHLWHDCMSAGQSAFREYWTAAGVAALSAFAELGDFPE
jgi:hypothetical protein